MRNRFSIRLMAAAACAAFLLAESAEADKDWREQGVVTPVKNIGSPMFDASWAFAVTGAAEGQHAIKSGTLVSLSEQELVDCVGASQGDVCTNSDCGQAPCGLDFAVTNGLCSESSYPYTARPGACKSNECTPAAQLDGWSRVAPGDETALIAAIDKTPVIARLSIGDHGSPLAAYTNYVGGLFSPPAFDDTVHTWVLIVGYINASPGTTAHYIVKNSLGTTWGDRGYMYLPRGSDELGVADFAYSPEGTSSHGACALPDGSCADTTPAACLAAGGTYGGDLSFCAASCESCDADTTPPVVRASARVRPAKTGRNPLELTVAGEATDNCTIDPSTARYWIADSADSGEPAVTTPIVLGDGGSFSFTASLPVTRPGERGHHEMIFLSVEDVAGNKTTVSLPVL